MISMYCTALSKPDRKAEVRAAWARAAASSSGMPCSRAARTAMTGSICWWHELQLCLLNQVPLRGLNQRQRPRSPIPDAVWVGIGSPCRRNTKSKATVTRRMGTLHRKLFILWMLHDGIEG
jgi:hypothetical protein